MLTEEEYRARIVREARSWLGTPYVLGARVKGAGADCATLIMGIFQAVGIIPPDEQAHLLSADWWQHTTEERYRIRVVRHSTKTVEAFTYPTLEAKPGDILLVRAAGAKVHNHGGIVLEKWPWIIHAIAPVACVANASQHRMWEFQKVEVFSPWEKYRTEGYRAEEIEKIKVA